MTSSVMPYDYPYNLLRHNSIDTSVFRIMLIFFNYNTILFSRDKPI